MDGPQSADAKTFKNTEPHHSIASDVWGWTESNVVAPFVNNGGIEPVNAAINVVNFAGSPVGAHFDYVPKMAQNQNRNGVESVVQTVSGALGTAAVFIGASKLTGLTLGKAAAPFAEDSAFANFARNPLTAQIAGPTLYEGLKNPNEGESRIGNMLAVGTAFGVFGLGGKLTSDLTGLSLYGARAGIGAGGMVSGTLMGDLYNHHTPTTSELLTSALTGGILNVAVPAMLERNVKMAEPVEPKAPVGRDEVTLRASGDAVEPPKPPNVMRARDGRILVIDNQGKAASFIDGQWQPGVQFDGAEIVKFLQVKGDDINTIAAQAAEALRKSSEKS